MHKNKTMIAPPQLTHQIAQYVCETDAFCKLLMSYGMSCINAYAQRAVEYVMSDDTPNLIAWMHHNARNSLCAYNHMILKFAAQEASFGMLQEIVRTCIHYNMDISNSMSHDRQILMARRAIVNKTRALNKALERNKMCIYTRFLILNYV